MNKRILVILCMYVLWILLLSGCKANSEANIPLETAKAGVNDVNIANPAAVNCEKQGFRLEIRNDSDGNQYGVCIFPDGSECDEWAYFRGECGPASQNPTTENKAVEAAKILLAGELNIATSQITVFSLKQMSWPDSCLGIPAQDEVCNPEVIPGFRVTLTAGATNYTYRTDLTGENLRLETAGIQG